MSKCIICGKGISKPHGFGNRCCSQSCSDDYMKEEGYWIDPAGGIHHEDDEDPARLYE